MDMKYWIWILVVLSLAGCGRIMTEQPADERSSRQSAVSLKDHGPAPEWQNEVWLNTEAPLPLAELRDKVVLLEMWTYG